MGGLQPGSPGPARIRRRCAGGRVARSMTSRPTISQGGGPAVCRCSPHRRRATAAASRAGRGPPPSTDLRVVVGVAAGQQEGMVVGELLQGAPDLGDRGPGAGDAEGDVPQAGVCSGSLAPEAVAGRDAGQGALLAGRAGRCCGSRCGAAAGRRRSRAHSAHDGLLHAHGSARWSAGLVPEGKLSRPHKITGGFGGTYTADSGDVSTHYGCRITRSSLCTTSRSYAGRVHARVPGWSGRAAGAVRWRRS